ncbi:MAG: hypothetical protein QOC91_992 [Solirubrobacteraceae bacterium]|nr:hypothetical protein [Solirubrobacteraceae bacterium]
MSAAELGFAISVFAASAVEAVEALTIVLAVGNARSWPSALSGVGLATVVLAAAIALLGTAITALPIDELRIAVGALLLLVGAQWLRKAVLRASGRKAMHDESDSYARELAAAREAGRAVRAWDPYSFVVSAKGVLLEGFEVALIVVTFGASRGRIGLAAAAAAAAVAVVVAAGFAVRAPLARVPENTMKFAVGVMLVSFGIFWSGEGAGLSWPGGDAILLAIIPTTLACSAALVLSLRRSVAV